MTSRPPHRLHSEHPGQRMPGRESCPRRNAHPMRSACISTTPSGDGLVARCRTRRPSCFLVGSPFRACPSVPTIALSILLVYRSVLFPLTSIMPLYAAVPTLLSSHLRSDPSHLHRACSRALQSACISATHFLKPSPCLAPPPHRSKPAAPSPSRLLTHLRGRHRPSTACPSVRPCARGVQTARALRASGCRFPQSVPP